MTRFSAWTPAILLVGAMWFDLAVPGLLGYDRAAILERGQAWRMLSGHLVHAGWLHCTMNIAALLLLQTLNHPAQKVQTLLADMLIMSLVSSVLLLVFVPDLGQYNGFSGVLHGLWMQAGIRHLHTLQRWQGVVMLAALMLKLLAEYGGHSSGYWSGMQIIPESHLLGAMAGLWLSFLPTLPPESGLPASPLPDSAPARKFDRRK